MKKNRLLLLTLALAVAIMSAAPTVADDAVYSPALAALNDSLRAAGVSHVAIESAELLFNGAAWDGVSPHLLIANNRSHLTASGQFVENDPRRSSPPNTISYLVDQSDGVALSWNATQTVVLVLPNAVTEPELDASMAAWDDFQCNGPDVVKLADGGADPDLVDGLALGNPALIGTPFADVTQAGWLPAAFFNAIAPNGASFILGVTFTFNFIDGAGNPTDIDGNRRPDVAFREIYYNRSFPWGPGGNPFNVDIQSVGIHEAGHAFGLGHFGKVTLKSNGSFQYSPKAIMNAVYISEDRRILGADIASFCQIWANSH